MLAGIHFFAGSSLGVLSNNAFVAFSLGFISHHFLDRLPHLDLNIFQDKKYGSLKDWDLTAWLIFLTEFAFFLLLTFYFLGNYSFKRQIFAFIGGLGSILPDIISFSLRTFFPYFKSLDFYQKFHKNFHYQFKKQYFWPIIVEIFVIYFSFLILSKSFLFLND